MLNVKVDHVIESLSLSDDHLMRLSSKMSQELVRGLHQSTNDEAEIKMLPSFVTSTPDGSENGEFLALDLGGTNFRIILVKIQSGDSPKIQMDNQVYAISNELMTGTGTQLFDHMVNCLWDFLVERDMMCQLLPIGFTFSFPTKNLGIKQTILVNWSKGFTATGVVGEDIGQLLNDAINRKFKNFELKIMATVVNDTVGTLVSCAFDHHDTCMGLIVGTGTNMCYMEAQSNIELLNNHKTLEGEMCINTEWGAFGDNSGALDEIKTSYDIDIDRNSPNVGQHIFEKMISGMYMGELARLIIVDLSNKGHLFQSIDSNSLFYKSGFSTAFVSQILHMNDNCSQALGTTDIFKNKYGVTCSDEDMTKLRKICESLSIRAASLCAIGVIAVARKIIEHRGQRHLVVGVDGSVYRKHPTFKSLLINTTHRLAPELNIDFQLSTDGSGRGAALVAAVESRIQHIVTQ
uniref:Phosphotransferase n=1 Tax=Ciona intestinalis TaxID=7719 RepID=H2XUD0_CIOIN